MKLGRGLAAEKKKAVCCGVYEAPLIQVCCLCLIARLGGPISQYSNQPFFNFLPRIIKPPYHLFIDLLFKQYSRRHRQKVAFHMPDDGENHFVSTCFSH